MAQMLVGQFWLQSKDLGLSLGAIGIIFRAGSVRLVPGCGGWAEVRPIGNSGGVRGGGGRRAGVIIGWIMKGAAA